MLSLDGGAEFIFPWHIVKGGKDWCVCVGVCGWSLGRWTNPQQLHLIAYKHMRLSFMLNRNAE